MDLDQLITDRLSDPSLTLPVPAGALARVDRTARRLRNRRRSLAAVPALALVAMVPLLSGVGGGQSVQYATPDPTPSPTPPPLPYQPATAAMRLNCAVGVTEADFDRDSGFTVVLGFVTGDPVADCARAYRQEKGSAPVLRAYSDGHVYLTVIPASWTPLASYRLLPADFTVDVRRVALEQALDDPVDGADSDCLSDAQAIERARQIVRGSGLDYTVTKYDAAPIADGHEFCARALLPSEAGTKVLITANTPHATFAPTPTSRLVTLLRRDIAENCVSLAAARTAVTKDAAEAGVTLAAEAIVTTRTGGDRCTRVDLFQGGGNPIVILRSS